MVSGHLAPSNPESLVDWEALARVGGSICVIMGVRHVREIASTLVSAGLLPSTPAVAVQEGETASQRVVHATASTLADAMEAEGIASPAVYVIGEVAGLASAG